MEQARQSCFLKRSHAIGVLDEDDDDDASDEQEVVDESPLSNRTITKSLEGPYKVATPAASEHQYYCLQPAWSQKHFKEMMMKQLTEWYVPKTPVVAAPTENITPTMVTNTSKPSVVQLLFTPKLGNQKYNLQKFQEYMRSEIAKGVDLIRSSRMQK